MLKKSVLILSFVVSFVVGPCAQAQRAQIKDINALTLAPELVQAAGSVAHISVARGSKAYSYTGFLVAPDIIATSGSALKNATLCRPMLISFGWQSTLKHPPVESAQQKYQCKKILALEYAHNTTPNYALIQLNQAPKGRKALTLQSPKGFEGPMAFLSIVRLPLAKRVYVLAHPKSYVAHRDGQQVPAYAPWYQHGAPLLNFDTFEVMGLVSDYISGQASKPLFTPSSVLLDAMSRLKPRFPY